MTPLAPHPLHIAAIGASTSIGGYAQASLAAVASGLANFADHPFLLDLAGSPYKVAQAPYINATLKCAERMQTLLNLAISDCCEHWKSQAQRLPAVVCLPLPRPSLGAEQIRELLHQLMRDCPGLVIQPEDIVMQGHASVFYALKRASHWLSQPGHEFCLLLGVDSWLDNDTLTWLDLHQQLLTANNAYGFIPGEAGAAMLLARKQSLADYGLSSHGQIVSFSTADEPVNHSKGVCTGQGLTQALQKVLQAIPNEQKLAQTVCDLNGQMHRVDEWGFTLARVNERFVKADEFTCPADCWGDIGAASGLMNLMLATQLIQKDSNDGQIHLIWGSSMHQMRGAALLIPTPQASQ